MMNHAPIRYTVPFGASIVQHIVQHIAMLPNLGNLATVPVRH